ncbi:MAG TPA: carbohydrate-binding module family 20 domain-containing protein [Bacteroidota bacterium]|nr:carbohydrate-binding module family 20 domain-containing protein [Bacteroidota bacterium]
MKKKYLLWLFSGTLILGLMPLVEEGTVYGQTYNVTFRVNMSIKMREGAFVPGSGDIVRVAGSFNNWGSSTDTLKDADGDSIYTKTVALSAGNIEYKFLKTLRAGSDWEGGDNKTLSVSKDTTLPVLWFDNDSVYTPPVLVPVTFQVNMRVKILEQLFVPSSDIVRVAGSFNGWGSSTDTLKDADNDSIYTKTINLQEGSSIQYKFLKTPRGGDWEDGSDRQYTVPTGGGPIPVVYFNNDSVVNVPVSGNILWRVDMSAYQQLGWFQRTTNDSMEVRGPFNGWSGTKMERVPGTEIYEVSLPYTGSSFDDVPHKFFMDIDSATATARFPGYVHGTNREGYMYDHPADRGDGNRIFNLGNGGNLQTNLYYFSSINPNGLLLNTTDTVTVTFRVDMRPAMTYVDPFVKGTDTLKWVWFDDLARSVQGVSSSGVTMTDANNDSIYEASVTIRGKTHYNFLYYYRYIHGGAQTGTVNEGGGLGVQNPYRSRYIQPATAGVGNVFPRNYTMPVDVWQKNAPMPAETAPFNGLTSVAQEQPFGPPSTFELLQNYPNPFNPSTRIRYTLPQHSRVTLKVYNILGQVVTTLLNNEEQPAGNHVVLFEANRLASGVYFYSLQAGPYYQVRKMILMK